MKINLTGSGIVIRKMAYYREHMIVCDLNKKMFIQASQFLLPDVLLWASLLVDGMNYTEDSNSKHTGRTDMQMTNSDRPTDADLIMICHDLSKAY